MPVQIQLSNPGPWHLGVLHPLSHGSVQLEVEVAGQDITRASLDFAMSARGDEKLLEVRDVPQGLALAGRLGWLTSAATETAYARALESLLGLQPPPRAAALRDLLLAVQRVLGRSWRLAAIADLLDGSGAEWLLAREPWLTAHEQLAGARVHDVYVRLGGVAADIDAATISQLIELAATPWPALDSSAAAGHGRLAASMIERFELDDLRAKDHDAAERIEALVATLSDEVAEVGRLAGSLPEGAVNQLLPKSIRIPVGEAFASESGANGGLGVWVFGDGGKAPQRVSFSSNSDRAVALFETAAVGMSVESARWLLATLPIAPGEVAL